MNNNNITKNTTSNTRMHRTTSLVLCALFCALTGICAAISIPLPFTPVPVSLATLSVFMAGALLGPKYGVLSQLLYLLLGCFGAPIFHNLTGGLGILVGPTGGFIAGYIPCAYICGLLCQSIFSRYAKKQIETHSHISASSLFGAICLGNLSCYALGMIWFAFTTGSSIYASFIACILPFIPCDILKALAATLLLQKLYPIIIRNRL